MSAADDGEPLMINGRAVSPVLLEARAIRRCHVEECQSYCCTGGVWINTTQVEDLLAHQALIIPHLPPDRRDPSKWFDGTLEPDPDSPGGGMATGTAVVPNPTHPVGETCLFLREDRKCALQAAGIAAGEHPWRFKPFYCALHPLTVEGGQLMLAEQSKMFLEGGSCNRPNPAASIPVYRLFEAEVKLILGEDGYAQLAAVAQTAAAPS